MKKPTTTQWNDKAAALLAARILCMQRNVANALQNWERGLSNRQKKRGLLLFCLLGTFAFSIPLYRGLYETPSKALKGPETMTSPLILPKIERPQPDTLLPQRKQMKTPKNQDDEDTTK